MAWSGSGLFTSTMRDILDATTAMDLNTDTFKIALFNNSVTPAYDAASASTAFNTGTWVLANEVSGTGWASGGVALTGVTLSGAAPAAGQMKWDATDVSQASTTLSTIHGCLIYDDTIAAPVADQGLIAIAFSGAPYSTVNGTLTITWHADGIWYLDLVP
jgi:hypothetical protein